MYAEVKNSDVVTWPYDYDTLIKQNPNTSFPSDVGFLAMYLGSSSNMAGNSLVKVVEQDPPVYLRATQTIVQKDKPELLNGEWVIAWQIVELSSEQQAQALNKEAKSVRQTRDEKLKESDWTQVADSPVDKTVWATYRQALRDVPSQTGFPWEVTFPDAP